MKKRLLLYIITRNRGNTTLPLVLYSILTQKEYPDAVKVFLEKNDVKGVSNDIYKYFKDEFKRRSIDFDVVKMDMKFLDIRNYINNNLLDYEWHLRIDDDEILENNLIYRYFNFLYNEKKDEYDNIGAVGGYVIIPSDTYIYSNKIDSEYAKNFGIEARYALMLPNVQWCVGKGYVSVEHLHSSFIYRPGIVSYPNLPDVAHTEETLFTNFLYRKGYKLYVILDTGVLHYRSSQGGLRDMNEKERIENMYKECEEIFYNYLMENNDLPKPLFFIVNPNGIGDNFAMLSVLDKILSYHSDKQVIVISSNYKIFYNIDGIKVFSIYDGVRFFRINPNDYNIYSWKETNKINYPLDKCYEMFYIK